MDPRTSVAVALCLLGACGGCVTQPVPPRNPAELAAAGIKPRNENDAAVAKKKAAPEVAVAFANFNATSATKAQSPAEADAFRERARKAYQEALALDANHKEALLGMARLYAQTEDQDRAVAGFRKVLEKHPKEAAVWLELGLCHARKKEWAAAVENLEKAVALDPDNREFGTTLGLTLARAGQFERGVAVLGRFQGRAEAHYTVARMAERCGHPEVSRQHLQFAVSLKPELASAREMLARYEAPAAGGDPGVVRVGFGTPQAAPPQQQP